MKIDTKQLERIATRYIELLRKFDMLDEEERAFKLNLKLKLIDWHEREPLNFNILEQFPDLDFSHDLGGIMRDDVHMSARSALTYHPIQ